MKEIEQKMDELLEILSKDQRIIDLQEAKKRLFNHSEFLAKVERLKQLDIYSSEYKELKKELFQNPDFVEFKHLENEINLLILAINQKLKPLTNERSCNHESH